VSCLLGFGEEGHCDADESESDTAGQLQDAQKRTLEILLVNCRQLAVWTSRVLFLQMLQIIDISS